MRLFSYILFCVILFTSCSSQKRTTTINNSKLSLLKECKNIHPRECIKQTISEIIVEEANRRGIILKEDHCHIFIRIKTDGSVSVLRVQSTNDSLYKVCRDVLDNLPPLQPTFDEKQKTNVVVSPFWYFFIKDNKLTDVDLSQRTRMDLF